MKRFFFLGPWAFHLFALLLTFRLAHWPLWGALLLFSALWLLRRWRAAAFAPLYALYAFALLRLIFVYGLRQTPPPALDYVWALVVCGAGVLFVSLSRWAWPVFALCAAGFFGYLLWYNRPAGVTGSDPLAYVWMAVDFAERGTFQHHFPLAPLAVSLGLSPLPAQHVGYVLPTAQGLASTVWPPGYSILLAGAYRLAGQAGMMSLNTVLAVFNVAATFALVVMLVARPSTALHFVSLRSGRLRPLAPVAVGAGAALILATSVEQYVRQVVPLADGAAQLFTTLTLLFALLALRPSLLAPRFSLLAGFALALAYSMRYTQVLIAPGLVVVAFLQWRDWRARLRFLLPLALAAFLGALPDLIYRTALYGSPFRFGTGELALFSWSAIGPATRALSVQLFAPSEFGGLWPWALLGAVYLGRRHHRVVIGLTAVYLPLLAFHLFYPFLKLRDVLSLYAPLAALSALGIVMAVMTLGRRGKIWRGLAVMGLALVFLPRLQTMTDLTRGFFTFGYLRPEQHRALGALESLTEPNAVIACSLNSGAVELYGHRLAVRPGHQLQPNAAWTEADWLKFVEALRAEGRPVYLLMDSPEMEAPLAAVQSRWAALPSADLSVPVFFIGGGSSNRTVPLYRVLSP